MERKKQVFFSFACFFGNSLRRLSAISCVCFSWQVWSEWLFQLLGSCFRVFRRVLRVCLFPPLLLKFSFSPFAKHMQLSIFSRSCAKFSLAVTYTPRTVRWGSIQITERYPCLRHWKFSLGSCSDLMPHHVVVALFVWMPTS